MYTLNSIEGETYNMGWLYRYGRVFTNGKTLEELMINAKVEVFINKNEPYYFEINDLPKYLKICVLEDLTKLID